MPRAVTKMHVSTHVGETFIAPIIERVQECHLNYLGNLSDAVIGQVIAAPNGGIYVASNISYDEETNRTRVRFSLVTNYGLG
jgi:hypothetical protein